MALIPQTPRTIAPGAVHVPGWLTRDAQRDLVAACRDWSRPPAGMTRVKTPGGRWMSVRQVCLGLHWSPYRYSRTATDGTTVKAFPDELGRLALAAAETAYGHAGDYAPDIGLINFYDAAARMGMHQDKEEKCDAPVVSLSLGDTCVFRFGNTANRNKPWTDVTLESGDLFVFGQASRWAFHGVPKTMPGTGPHDIGMGAGRLNITVRQSGIDLTAYWPGLYSTVMPRHAAILNVNGSRSPLATVAPASASTPDRSSSWQPSNRVALIVA